jgi:phospholipase/lecithinase/hemolysin
MKKLILSCLLSAAALASSAAWAELPKYNAMYVFGDSLSDIGNDTILTRGQKISPTIPPSESPHRTYYEGRFSNGPVAVEYLWRLITDDANASLVSFLTPGGAALNGSVNFAFGGSTSEYLSKTPGGFYVPGLLGQVELFRAIAKRKKPQNQALYVVWTGGNDYIYDPTSKPLDVIENIEQTIKTLHSVGARHFLVPNLPDLGLAPLVLVNGPEASLKMSQLTADHNATLARALDRLNARLIGTRIYRVNINFITRELLESGEVAADLPALEVVASGTGAVSCLFTSPSACPDVNVDPMLAGYYFWDVLHPTSYVHRHYGRAMFEARP